MNFLELKIVNSSVQIINQSILRGSGEVTFVDGVAISSVSNPQLAAGAFYIRGTQRNRDDIQMNTTYCRYNPMEMADLLNSGWSDLSPSGFTPKEISLLQPIVNYINNAQGYRHNLLSLEVTHASTLKAFCTLCDIDKPLEKEIFSKINNKREHLRLKMQQLTGLAVEW
jgi:hypothetical protein